MFPVLALWPLALLLALCGVTTHVVEADASSATALRLWAFIEARVAADAAHAAEIMAESDSAWPVVLAGGLDVAVAFEPRPRPPLFAAGAAVGTFMRRSHARPGDSRHDAWRAAWRSALEFDPTEDLERLALMPPLGSLLPRRTAVPPRVSPSEERTPVPAVDARISVTRATARELAGRRSPHGGPRTRFRVRRGGEDRNAATLAECRSASTRCTLAEMELKLKSTSPVFPEPGKLVTCPLALNVAVVRSETW